MKFQMIPADDNGETHFGVENVAEREVPFEPPPNPTGQMCHFGAVETMFVFSVPAGTDVPAHNAPQPYIAIILSGEGEVATSDGESRRFHPGEILFCNDLT
jgi:quercetin dioxygenase-like cupin family protein